MEPLVYVHGAFHWIGDLMVPGKFYVVSFSISNEVYGDVPLLDEMGKKKFPPPRFWPFIIGWNAMLLYH
ncbi:hypothetical protein P3S68_010634 [Capsicum galapagoense]